MTFAGLGHTPGSQSSGPAARSQDSRGAAKFASVASEVPVY